MGKVSVIIPVFNQAQYLQEAVNSAKQTEVGEILIIDDGSTDNSLSIAKKLEAEISIVKVFSHPNNQNRGVSASRNLGITNARFPYIAFLDADDMYLPHRFEEQLSILENDLSCQAVYGWAEEWNQDFTQAIRKLGVESEVLSTDIFEELLLGRKGHFHTPTVLIRSSAFDKTGGFDENLKLHQDTELWLRMTFHGSWVSSGTQTLAYIRKHGQNNSRNRSTQSTQQLWKRVLFYFENKAVSPRQYNLMMLRLATAIYQPPAKKEWLALFPFLIQYPRYFWVLIKKSIFGNNSKHSHTES
ncbi:glycosyltransferase family 2 protein [Fulvivirgaceae bacterium LMO-SS25]